MHFSDRLICIRNKKETSKPLLIRFCLLFFFFRFFLTEISLTHRSPNILFREICFEICKQFSRIFCGLKGSMKQNRFPFISHFADFASFFLYSVKLRQWNRSNIKIFFRNAVSFFYPHIHSCTISLLSAKYFVWCLLLLDVVHIRFMRYLPLKKSYNNVFWKFNSCSWNLSWFRDHWD